MSAGGTSFGYDANRNVTNDGTRAYAYDGANRMTSAGSTSFSYDPTGGLYDIGAQRLASVGGERLALYTTSGGALHRRIVPGAGLDEAAAYYHGAGTTTRRWPLADQLGSVVAYANASGAAANINTYDEYGRPGSGNAEFLQYTGQLAIASAPGVYNYRNRFYQADVGRFLQTDPILYGDGLNLYAYVGNDPINRIDPWGLDDNEIVVEGRRPRLPDIVIIFLAHVLIDDVGTYVADTDHARNDDSIYVIGRRREYVDDWRWFSRYTNSLSIGEVYAGMEDIVGLKVCPYLQLEGSFGVQVAPPQARIGPLGYSGTLDAGSIRGAATWGRDTGIIPSTRVWTHQGASGYVSIPFGSAVAGIERDSTLGVPLSSVPWRNTSGVSAGAEAGLAGIYGAHVRAGVDIVRNCSN